MKENEIKKLTYEEAVTRLEEIVQKLENSDVPLEESLASFQEGMALARYCREKLTEIEYRVDYLLKEEEKSLNKLSATELEAQIKEGYYEEDNLNGDD